MNSEDAPVRKVTRRRIALLAATCGVLVATISFGQIGSAQVATGAPANTPSAYSGGRLMTADPGGGYWTVTDVGAIASYGGAPVFGSPALSGIRLSMPVVGMAPTPDGQGYWLVASDGGIFSYGDAQFYGSTGAMHLSQPIVGMASTPDGRGYWLVASDGGIFSFGDTQFYGSTGAIHLSQPVVGMASTPDGRGYWLVASDGGIFSFGDTQFYGSTGAIHLSQPVVGMASTPDGQGYWLVASDGGIFSFGDAQFYGSLGGSGKSVIGIIISPPTLGYTLVATNGTASVFTSSSTTTTASTTSTTPVTTPVATGPSTTYGTGTADSSQPSGMDPPGANALAGYTQTYVTDFPGTSLPAGWYTYSGTPGGDPGALWASSHDVVGGGMLQLETYQDPAYNNQWVSGGLKMSGISQIYGAYFVRSRVVGTGTGPDDVALLWPANNSWPPEVDFNETLGSDTSSTATLHYGSTNNMDYRTASIDMTQWHTWGVIWTPTSITYTVDGVVWGTVAVASEIPNTPMTLDLQQQTMCDAGVNWGCPTTPQSMDVNWVAEYAPN
jgi:hypothetical protein